MAAAIFKDINPNFARHPLTNDLTILVNDDVVKNAVKNIVLTAFYERPFNNTFGTRIRRLLFEPFTPGLREVLRTEIRNAIANYEPRCEVKSVEVYETPDEHVLEVFIVFSVRDLARDVSVRFKLDRVR